MLKGQIESGHMHTQTWVYASVHPSTPERVFFRSLPSHSHSFLFVHEWKHYPFKQYGFTRNHYPLLMISWCFLLFSIWVCSDEWNCPDLQTAANWTIRVQGQMKETRDVERWTVPNLTRRGGIYVQKVVVKVVWTGWKWSPTEGVNASFRGCTLCFITRRKKQNKGSGLQLTLGIDLIAIPLCGEISVLTIFPLVDVHHTPVPMHSVKPNGQQLIPWWTSSATYLHEHLDPH